MMTSQNTIAWIAVSIALGLALAVIFYSNRRFYEEFLLTSASYGTPVLPKRPDKDKMLVEIDFGDKSKRVFEGAATAPSTLDRALEVLTSTGRFTLSARNDKILSIAGVRGTWKIYKNGAKVNGPLSSLLIAPGDRYSLRLEK